MIQFLASKRQKHIGYLLLIVFYSGIVSPAYASLHSHSPNDESYYSTTSHKFLKDIDSNKQSNHSGSDISNHIATMNIPGGNVPLTKHYPAEANIGGPTQP